MLPALGDAKVDKILSQYSAFYTNENYISEFILPVLKVKEKSGKTAKYGKENLYVYTDQIYRAPGTRAHGADYTVSQGSYLCRERSLEKPVPDEFRDNTDDPYDPFRDATAVIMDNIWVNQEAALASVLEDTAVLTQNTTLAGTDQWSDYVNSDPIGDIRAGKQVIRAATGKKPNIAFMGEAVKEILMDHPDVREQMKYTNGGQFDEAAFTAFLKKHFSLDEIYYGDAVKNTADPGQADSLSDIWGKHFWLAHRSPKPTLMRASFGFTPKDLDNVVDRYREESHKRDVVRVARSYDQHLSDVALAYLIKNAIA